MTADNSPFNDLLNLLGQLPEGNYSFAETEVQKLNLEAYADDGVANLISWLATWQDGTKPPSVTDSHICLLASTYKGYEGSEDIKKLIKDASTGQAQLNPLCVKEGIGLRVLELAPELPHDPSKDWPEAECMAAIAFGMEATAAGGNLLALSDLAPGNDTAAKQILSSLRSKKDASAIDKLNFLREFGGREIAAIVGAIIAARSRRLPTLIEGWGALAAYFTLYSIAPDYVTHVRIASFRSKEQKEFATDFDAEIQPILNQTVTAGAGCGAAMAITLLSSSIALLR